MATRITTICDGCEEEIDLSLPHLVVTCNLHKFHEVDPLNPSNPHGRITTGAVVTLTFCKPSCTVLWFEKHAVEGGNKFELEDPPVPVATEPYVVPVAEDQKDKTS